MFRALSSLVLVASVALCLSASAWGQEETSPQASKTRWSGEVGVGAEYDTNVSVDEVDLSSGESDYAQVVDFELGLKHKFSDKIKGSLTYDISQSSYSEFSRVDRLTQILGAEVTRKLGRSSLSLSGYFIDSRLDGDGFLNYVRISPSLSGFLAKKWFARGAYVYAEREIDQRPQRDADTQSGEIDVYFFQRGLRSYFNVGYKYRDEDAIAPELDFQAHALKARYIRRFELFDRQAKVEFALRYEERDYLNPEPTINESRADDRIRFKFDFEIPVTKRFLWQFSSSYGDYVSNLPRADFTQTIVSTRLQYSW